MALADRINPHGGRRRRGGHLGTGPTPAWRACSLQTCEGAEPAFRDGLGPGFGDDELGHSRRRSHQGTSCSPRVAASRGFRRPGPPDPLPAWSLLPGLPSPRQVAQVADTGVGAHDVLKMNQHGVVGGDVVTVEELPVVVLVVDDVDDGPPLAPLLRRISRTTLRFTSR